MPRTAKVRVAGVLCAGALVALAAVCAWAQEPSAVVSPATAPSAARAAYAANSALPIDVSTLLEPLRAKHDVPGLAACLVRGDGTLVFQGATGVRQAGAEVPLRFGDKFHLGSCTKAMTATLCAILVEEGTLSWDSTIGDVFPELFAAREAERPEGDGDAQVRANPLWKGVTLRHLLTNRSGAPADLDKGGLWGRLWRFKGEPKDARRLLLEGVVVEAPLSAPGAKYLYSDAGFAIAGHMAEVKAGKAWETLIAERLWAQLGITSGGFGAPGAIPPKAEGDGPLSFPIDQPQGHRLTGLPVQPGPGSDNPAAIGPAGTVHMTLADWSKFLALHLRGSRDELRKPAPGEDAARELPAGDPLSRASFVMLHTPADPATPQKGYAMGWNITSRSWAASRKDGNQRVFTHNGSNTMWFCVTWASVDRNFAVLVACNQGGPNATKATDDAAGLLIRELGKLEKASKAK